jgi:hypothetical protein
LVDSVHAWLAGTAAESRHKQADPPPERTTTAVGYRFMTDPG